MHDVVAPCHIDVPAQRHVDPIETIGTPSNTPTVEREFEYGAGEGRKWKPWTPNPAETIAGTSSRRSAPRAWRRALERSIAAGLLPGATATTLTIATDLAERMDYGTGHVRYRLQETMARTSLARSTVTKHVQLLRSYGWLAWAEHGSLRNALRSLGRPGYAPTAAVYAATIPLAFDEFAGNRLEGIGYRARVVGVTGAGREQQVAEAVDNSRRKTEKLEDEEASWTPSLRVVREEGQVQVSGGIVTTARARQRKTRSATILGQAINGQAVAAAHRIAAWVRPLVNWLQRSTRRQLSWVLLDLVLKGWDEQRILAWLQSQAPLGTWRPRFPHRRLAAALLAEQADEQRIADFDAEEARRNDPHANTELQAFFAGQRRAKAQERQVMAGLLEASGQMSGRTDAERATARAYALHERLGGGLAAVAEHMAVDFDDALDLYGLELCLRAERMDAIGALV